MNETAVVGLLTMAGTVVGAIAGGLIASRIDRTKAREERQEKLRSLQRDALAVFSSG